MRLRLRLGHALLAACWLAGGTAGAAGLQVAPVTLTLQPTQQADGLTLGNTGDAPLHAQVRVFRWTQEDGADKLEPTRAVLVSPPMLQLPPAGTQLVRVIRAGAVPGGRAEEAYRIWVDELPVAPTGGKGLQFVMRHSLPIFVAPAGAPPNPPQLQWALRNDGGQAVLEATNEGGTHAQLADLVFTDPAGQRIDVHAGLLGYVLPGARMRWPLKPPAAIFASGSWQAMINGTTAPQNIPSIDPSR